ncbi:hypothetical protein HanPSC8_Chr01g0024541 [Helianthus annuus]|nr:hypothetical protein HanPSC8_Chr01g0024541 [Helianthus annuus]
MTWVKNQPDFLSSSLEVAFQSFEVAIGKDIIDVTLIARRR